MDVYNIDICNHWLACVLILDDSFFAGAQSSLETSVFIDYFKRNKFLTKLF